MEVRLDRDDLAAVLEVVRDLYAAPTVEEFPASVLTHVRTLIECDSDAYNEIDPKQGRAVSVLEPDPIRVHPDRTFEEIYPLFAELAGEHPVIRRVAETGDGSAATIDDYWTREEFHASRLYRDVFRWVYTEHQLSVSLPTVLPRVVGVALNRGDPDHPFGGRDRSMLNVLRPHLSQAYQRAVDAAQVHNLLRASRQVLAATGASVLLLDHDEPIELTEGALVELFRYFGRPGLTDPLPARVRRWLEQQRSATVVSGVDDPAAVLRPLRSELAGAVATMRLVPSPEEPALMLTVERSNSETDLSVIGLSNREAQVLQLVAAGLTNGQIGRRMQISGATVKKHLEHCYRKLGVHNRVAAVALARDLLASDLARPPLRGNE